MKRPLPVTLISYLFIVAGTTGIIYHSDELKEILKQQEVIWIFTVRFLAIIGGVFMLRGANWARWLSTMWMFYHVVLSFYHSPAELITHVIFMIIVVIALYNRKANAYFKKR
jgi:hypothetical protein